MALNDYRNPNTNSNGKRRFDSTYYSRFRCVNANELTRLNITYTSGMMKLTIAKAPTPNDNYEDKISVFLTGYKANLLLNEMDNFEKEFDSLTPNQAFGVTTGMSEISTVITFHKNNNDGKAITIAKVDQTGRITERCEFNFPTRYDFSMRWEDFDSMKLSKDYDDELQYRMLKETISEFAKTYGGGAGYNTVDLARYDISRQNNNIETIMDKLGVPVQRNYNNRRSSSGNYFSNTGNNSGYNSANNNMDQQSTNRSIDDIDDMLNGEDLE